MNAVDKPRFVAVLVGLATVKPGKGLTPEALDIWWNAMQAWSLDDFRAAASHLARSLAFMPSPFDFEQLRKASRPNAAEAWAAALEHVRHGRWRREAAPPAIERAVRALGGWPVIAMSEEAKLHFLERRFAEIYDGLQDVEDVRTALPGIAPRPALAAEPKPVSELLPALRRSEAES